MFSALSQISKHSVDLAELVVEAEIFPAVLACLRDPDEYVRKNVTTLMREIAKHTPEVGSRSTKLRAAPQRGIRRGLELFPHSSEQT